MPLVGDDRVGLIFGLGVAQGVDVGVATGLSFLELVEDSACRVLVLYRKGRDR